MNVTRYILTGENKPDTETLESLKLNDKYMSYATKHLFGSVSEHITSFFYKFGKAEGKNDVSIKSTNIDELYKLMKDTNMSDIDKKALLYLKINSLNAVSKLQETLSNDVINNLTKDELRDVFIQNINTDNSKVIADKLADMTKDYEKNWNTIAHTELWNAKIYGQAVSIIESSKDGINTPVYKKLEKTACKHCRKHYLNSNGTPRIFTLRELISNGTNYGKKTADWKPVLGTLHPNCMCRLVVLESGEVSPKPDLVKAESFGTRKLDKTKLRYERRMVNSNGSMHEQGFWVKDADVKEARTKKDSVEAKENPKVQDANAKGYEGEPKVSNQKAVGPNKDDGTKNIAGLNQHNGADLPNQEPQTIQVTQGDKNIELPKVEFAKLPDKRKKYFGSILGFDYATALSLKYVYGKKAALKYLEETGFNVQTEDTEKAWSNAWNEIAQYLSIANSPNEKGDYTGKVFDIIHKEAKGYNEGDYARLVNTVTGNIYPALGVYDYDKDKVVGIVTQVGNKFYSTNGANTLDDIFARWLRGKIAPGLPLVPLDLKKDLKNEDIANWFFNQIKVQSANVQDKRAKEILKKIVKELTGQKSDL